MRIYLFIAAIAGGATYLLTPLIRHLAIRIGAVGEVRSRDVHTIPTPRMGGLAMMLGFVIAMLFASRIPFIQGLFHENHQAWVVMIGAVLICLLGMADDLWDLDWMLKMAGQLLISVFVAWGGLQIISLPLGSLVTASPSLSMAITAFLIVASINAVNFVDGLDGLASGIVAIGGIAFAIYSYVLARTSPSYASMATLIDVAMVGICTGFIMHNWHPAKLFMGDSGSMLLGYLITCASIVMTGLSAGVHADSAAGAGAVPAGARHVSCHCSAFEQGAVSDAPRPYASASSHAAHRSFRSGCGADSLGLGCADFLRIVDDSVRSRMVGAGRHGRRRRNSYGCHHVSVFEASSCRTARGGFGQRQSAVVMSASCHVVCQ